MRTRATYKLLQLINNYEPGVIKICCNDFQNSNIEIQVVPIWAKILTPAMLYWGFNISAIDTRRFRYLDTAVIVVMYCAKYIVIKSNIVAFGFL
jgi:hypothetical protein